MKDRIIYESIESLRREGLKFSVDTLAENLKISKKTVYKYFPDKETLALALYEKYYNDAEIKAEKIISSDSPKPYELDYNGEKDILTVEYDCEYGQSLLYFKYADGDFLLDSYLTYQQKSFLITC